MQDVELIEKVAHLEERAKSNTKRLDEHNTEIENLKNTYKITAAQNSVTDALFCLAMQITCQK